MIGKLLCRKKIPGRKVVYLTFDDGPVPETTPYVLNILKEEGVHATFFMVGRNIARYPELYHRVKTEGHTIGDHTFDHKIENTDLEKTNPLLFRPPHGRITPWQAYKILKNGRYIVLWDVMTHDWDKSYTPERILQRVKRKTRNGSIIICHDSVKSHNQTLPALRPIIQWLKKEMYEFETL